MKILVLDNYDSFTFNLVQYIEEILELEVDVYRNDEIKVEEVEAYDVIVLSPGPGIPKDAGIMPELIQRFAPTKAILGVCLGIRLSEKLSEENWKTWKRFIMELKRRLK